MEMFFNSSFHYCVCVFVNGYSLGSEDCSTGIASRVAPNVGESVSSTFGFLAFLLCSGFCPPGGATARVYGDAPAAPQQSGGISGSCTGAPGWLCRLQRFEAVFPGLFQVSFSPKCYFFGRLRFL